MCIPSFRNVSQPDLKRQKEVALFQSVFDEDLDTLHQLIFDGVDVNAIVEGATPLALATRKRSVKIVESLLKADADPDQFHMTLGFAPLHLVGNHPTLDIAKLLLAYHANPNIQNQRGQTPLHVAAICGSQELIELLIENKADINKTSEGWTPVHLAAVGNKNNLKVLIKAKSDLEMQDDLGYTPFCMAVREDLKDNIKILREALTFDQICKQKEIFKVKILAHSVNLAGSVEVKHHEDDFPYEVDLEESYAPYVIKKMNNATKAYALKAPSKILDQLLEAFESITYSDERNLKEIQEGKPILVITGFINHTVVVLFLGSYFIVCNRGDSSRKVVEAFKYDPDLLNTEILKKIKKIDSEESYKQLFFEELPQALHFESDKITNQIEELCLASLSEQSVGNCAWASPEAAVFVFFALSLSNQKTKKTFYSWLVMNQVYHLERYLGLHILRSTDNVYKVELHKARRKVTVIDQDFVEEAIKAIDATKTTLFQLQ